MSEFSKVVIISGASGSGKTTLAHHLLSCKDFNLKFSVSACTRPKRDMEIQGAHYIFLSIEQFKNKIKSNDFLEWEEVYPNHFYGTLKSHTMSMLNLGKNILFDVDVHGAMALKKHFKNQALSIFIQAPSESIAKNRLLKRNTESSTNLEIRLNKMKEEILVGKQMDYVVINDNLNDSKHKVQELIKAFLKV